MTILSLAAMSVLAVLPCSAAVSGSPAAPTTNTGSTSPTGTANPGGGDGQSASLRSQVEQLRREEGGDLRELTGKYEGDRQAIHAKYRAQIAPLEQQLQQARQQAYQQRAQQRQTNGTGGAERTVKSGGGTSVQVVHKNDEHRDEEWRRREEQRRREEERSREEWHRHHQQSGVTTHTKTTPAPAPAPAPTTPAAPATH